MSILVVARKPFFTTDASPILQLQPTWAPKNQLRSSTTPAAAMGRRAARSFFGGLEDEAEAPLELVLVVRDPVRERHARRRMGVMAAGVHVARDLGVEPFGRGQVRGVVKLLDEHAVHVEAKARDGAFEPVSKSAVSPV